MYVNHTLLELGFKTSKLLKALDFVRWLLFKCSMLIAPLNVATYNGVTCVY
jgi:hypothetical protein